MNPSTIVVAELVPEVDLGDVVMGVDQLVSVEVAVEHKKGTPTDTILKGVNTCTIVVAELVPESEYAAKLLA